MADEYTQPGEVVEEEVVEETPPAPEFVTKEDFASLTGKIEQLSLQFGNWGQPQAPAAPKGPSIAEQTAAIDEKLVQLDTQMDTAIAEGQSVSGIQRKREELIQHKMDLKYNTRIEELQSFGVFAIDQLTDKVVAKDMPMLQYPEVKSAYEKAIGTMSPDQRMNPEVRMTAYSYACGSNMDLIFDKKFEEKMRADAAEPQTPVGKPGREMSESTDPNRIPDPSEILSADNLQAIETAGKTVDSYYKAMGYPGGWEDYWIKTGKPDRDGPEEETNE